MIVGDSTNCPRHFLKLRISNNHTKKQEMTATAGLLIVGVPKVIPLRGGCRVNGAPAKDC
jgi:hypothetical protein